MKLEHITRAVIDGYLGFLANQNQLSAVSKAGCFKSVKTVLIALCRRGEIPWEQYGDSATFPTNPFPRNAKKSAGARPLCKEERQSFTAAVKTAVTPLLLEVNEPSSRLLSYALLVIALHTGRNTTPLLELTSDCLRPHPKEHLKNLVVYKRRGYSTSATPVRDVDLQVDFAAPVLPTVVRLIEKIIELTLPLRDSAPAHLKNMLWLFRPTRGGGAITSLSPQRLSEATNRLTSEYGLMDSDGKPLRVSVSALRKTFINRVNEILNDDVAATAAAAGNSIAITSSHYLRPGEASLRNWRMMGQVMTNELMSNSIGDTEKTPVGRCSDSKFGQYAPKLRDANCINFLECLRCQNYVVTGDDLHRLFSFYWRVYDERQQMDPHKWKRQYGHIVRLIERDVIAAGLRSQVFKVAQVDNAREKARLAPHPYWKTVNFPESQS